MELIYNNKKSKYDILNKTVPAKLETVFIKGENPFNKIIFGNNINVMKTLIDEYNMSKKIDLVYIDPPFSTNIIYKYNTKRTSTVSSSKKDKIAYSDKLKGEEYLEFIRERLYFIRELMADHASIYLHIDYKIGHYIKIIMDEIFGEKNFRNDITRIKCNPKNFKRNGYGNIKDLILFYTKSDKFIWNEPRQKMSKEDINKLFRKIDKKGRRYTTTPLHAPGETKNGNTGKSWKDIMPPNGRHWRYDPSVLDELERQGLIEWSKTGNPRKILYADEAKKKGKKLQDIWEFKDNAYPEYPTEKNLDLLKTIIRASSNPGQIVFDCFCGSGTTLIASHHLGRKWVGIDNSSAAIKSTLKKLESEEDDLFTKKPCYQYMTDNNKI